jgi:hypothetical protein
MSQDAPVRMERDAQGERALFEDIEVGLDLGSLEWTVEPEDIDKQCAVDEDYDPFYMVDSPWGGPVAPPQIQYRPPRWLLSRTFNIRGVFYRWEFENRKPIKPGIPITVSGTVADKWVKNEREFVAFEFTGTDPDGDVLFVTRRVHVLDVIERSAPRAGVGVDSGFKPEKI